MTAAFNKNVLSVINRELEADFAPAAFEHVALWNAEREWIEMRLRSRTAQTVKVQALDLAVDFADGEELRTEVSAKFRQEGVRTELAAAGLELAHWWTDGEDRFALSLSVARDEHRALRGSCGESTSAMSQGALTRRRVSARRGPAVR